LIICAEGGTSNGKQLLRFKKGCFVGLRAISPTIIKYDSAFIDMESSVLPLYAHFMLISLNFWFNIDCLELPDFEPNDYFWEHHQRKDEQKWETYARCMRDIMAKEGKLGKVDMGIEDKWEYKKLLYPNKKYGKYSD